MVICMFDSVLIYWYDFDQVKFDQEDSTVRIWDICYEGTTCELFVSNLYLVLSISSFFPDFGMYY